MHYLSRCAANRRVFSADLKLAMFSVGSWRKSAETSSRPSELQRTTELLAATVWWGGCRTSWRWLADRRR